MLTTANITARALIWLATLAIPAQGLQVNTCGCGGNERSQTSESARSCCSSAGEVSDGCCCAPIEPACCSQREDSSEQSCCGSSTTSGSSCQCGSDCQCGKVKAPTPVTPPAENTAPEKVTIDTASVHSTTTLCPPQTSQRQTTAASAFDAIAAIDRCISLCRFTL